MATTITDRAQGIILAEALKSPVRVATTANITLSGLQTIDGVVLSANDRVLVKSQTDAVENGIYVAASSAWTRSSDFNGIYDVVQGTRVYIAAGTLYAGYEATITTENPITIGTSEITFALLLVVDAGLSADIETVADSIADINTCADNIAAILAAPAEAIAAAASADDAEYWAGIAAGGGITSITAGTGITVDDTDPAAPEVAVDVGTAANKIVQLDGDAKLPAVDGSQLTNLPITTPVYPFVDNFRLTLTTGVPVTTSYVTSSSTIYLTPYNGNKISLYSGTAWETISSAEISKAISGLTSGKPYDVFCYNDAGTPTLEFLVWTNDTTRATALTRQDGVLVKTGDATRLYLGTFYTTGTTTTADSAEKRFVWNYYNRVRKRVYKTDTTATWSYTTATVRQANGSSSNQIEVVVGYQEDNINMFVSARMASGTANTITHVGIGVDSTTAFNSSCVTEACSSQVANINTNARASLVLSLSVGYHKVTWLEYGGTGAVWSAGAGGALNPAGGLWGEVHS